MKLQKNMGGADRIIRSVIAAGMIDAYSTGKIKGIAGFSMLVLSGIFLFTSATASCPVYEALGIDTIDESEGKKPQAAGIDPI